MSGGKVEFIVKWSIENYSFCAIGNKNCLSCPKFAAENLDGSEWDINIYPRGESAETKGYVSLHLMKYSSDFSINEKQIDLSVKLCNADDETILALDKENGIVDEWGCYTFSKVLKFEELEEKVKKFSKNTLVICCRLSMDKNPDKENSQNKSCSLKTLIGYDKFSFNWNVSCSDSKDVLMKKVFTDMNQTQFETIIRTSEDDVLIEISRVGRRNYRNHKVKCQIYLLNNEGTDILSSSDFFYFDCEPNEKNIWCFPPFFKKSLLFAGLSDCCSTIQFNFFVSNDMKVNEFSVVPETFNHDSDSPFKVSESKSFPSIVSMQNDFYAILANEKYADVELLVDNEAIRVHKLILASRSPVFSTMFDQDMMENQTGRIDIPDISLKTMKLFLKFLYTGALDQLEWNTALELLLAAEKYQVPSLKERCSSALMTSSLCADSVCEVVSVADMVGDQILKTAAITYIKRNVVKVLGSPNWPKWIRKNGELGSEILCKLSEKTVSEHSDV